jgi:hypothetical protein
MEHICEWDIPIQRAVKNEISLLCMVLVSPVEKVRLKSVSPSLRVFIEEGEERVVVNTLILWRKVSDLRELLNESRLPDPY